MSKISKVLIANRGEVAVRIIRACKELGIKTVSIHSLADSDSLHVLLADESVCVGQAVSSESYLNIPNILAAAEVTDADAIHPGYGFLSENAKFAQICRESNILFIGPTPHNIEMLGDKARAKEIMKKNGVPTVPGSDGIVKDEKEALKIAHQIGYPVIVKAAAGGGGKGMRIAHTDMSLLNAYNTAKVEAEKAFGNPNVYIEKFIENPRHIEIQIVADNYGNVIHLGERDCSIQRRHQKLVEESPSPIIDDETRQRIGEAAIRAAKAVGYQNVGTIEFLYDLDTGEFYFMEMNTRIQVEHPVTEWVTAIDLVKQQILLAAGEKLGYKQEDIELFGHAIECRINAEDPDNDFRPAPGTINAMHTPGGPGVRIDTHIYTGYKVPPYYDSMIAKVITHGRDRAEALARMRRSLEEFFVDGVITTRELHIKIMNNEDFISGNYSVNFLEKSGLLTKK